MVPLLFKSVQHMQSKRGTVFERVGKELLEIMNRKGYSRISDFRGKLKEYDSERAKLSRKLAKEQTANEISESNQINSLSSGNSFAFLMIAALLAIIAALYKERVVLLQAHGR